MKNKQMIKVIALILFLFGVMTWGTSCEKKQKATEKAKTVSEEPLKDFKAQISVESAPNSLKKDSTYTIKIKVKNISNSADPVPAQSRTKNAA